MEITLAVVCCGFLGVDFIWSVGWTHNRGWAITKLVTQKLFYIIILIHIKHIDNTNGPGFLLQKAKNEERASRFRVLCIFLNVLIIFSSSDHTRFADPLSGEEKLWEGYTKSILLARNIQSTTGSIGIIVYSSHPIPFVQKQACCVESQNCNTQNTTRIEG